MKLGVTIQFFVAAQAALVKCHGKCESMDDAAYNRMVQAFAAAEREWIQAIEAEKRNKQTEDAKCQQN